MLTVLKIRFPYAGVENAIYPVVLTDESEVILIDCGYPGFLPQLQAAAQENGISLTGLTKVIITHHDFDHMGSLAELKRVYPWIKVYASAGEKDFISGQKKSLRLQQAESIFDSLPEAEKENAINFQRMLEAIEPVAVDATLNDGEYLPVCGGIEVVATPGHMPGHISLYIRDSKTLVSGDALVSEAGKLAIANPMYTLDSISARQSIQKLSTYEIDQIVCYHGGIYTGNIKAALASLVSS